MHVRSDAPTGTVSDIERVDLVPGSELVPRRQDDVRRVGLEHDDPGGLVPSSSTMTWGACRPADDDHDAEQDEARPRGHHRSSVQIDDGQAVDAERRGDLAAVMDVVLEDAPDDPLARPTGAGPPA